MRDDQQWQRYVIPLLSLATSAFALAWLNRSPGWGRALVTALLAVLSLAARA